MNPQYPARDYQEEARQAVMDGFHTAKRGLLVLPTGGGKNFVACSIMDAYPQKRILFLADRNELIEQPAESITEFLGAIPGLEKAENRCHDSDRLVVGSIQTLARRYKDFRPDRWDLIIADEAHLSMSESWQNVLKHFEDARVLGMTATPFRSDGVSLMSFYEKEFYRKTIDNLQDEGWLVPLEIHNMGIGININDIQIKRGIEGRKFDEQQVADRIEPYLEAIASELLNKWPERRVLAFLPLVEISKKFAKIAQAIGLRAEHVDGKDPRRSEIIKNFRSGQYQLLTNSQLLHTGFDAPICSGTLNLTPMFSQVRYQQIIGRSTRPLPQLVDDPRYNAFDRCGAIALSEKSDSIIFDPMFQFAEIGGLMIPEALSASSIEEAQEIRKRRLVRGETNLQQAQHDYIKEKEEEMLARLEAERRERQQREEGGTTVTEYAISTGDHFLASYQPVYSHETRAVAKFDRRLLQQRGIDPDSVKCRGQCDLVVRSINIRRSKGLAEVPVVKRLISLGVPERMAWLMLASRAREVLRAHAQRMHP